jgi:hypothetical protein
MVQAPSFAQSPNSPLHTTPPWPQTTLTDLNFARDTIRAQTPIGVGTGKMHDWLDAGFEIAQARALTAKSAADHYYIIAAYVHGFGDPHLNVRPNGSLPMANSPGFVVSAQGADAVVTWVDSQRGGSIKIGDKITACDSLDLTTLSARNVFSFTFNPDLPSDRRRAVTRLFLDRSVPFAPRPTTCTLNGRTERLDWRLIDETSEASPFWRAFQEAGLGPTAQFGVTEPHAGVLWVGVPTFGGGAARVGELQALVSALQARLRQPSPPKAIIIDVRGNSGGNSAWADKLANVIWGRLAAHAPNNEFAVDWRATQQNIDFMEETASQMGGQSSLGGISLKWRMVVIPGLKRALAAGNPFWREGRVNSITSGGIALQRPKANNVPGPKYFVLSNGTCMSACLGFLDRALFVPGVKLIGSASGADGNFMEIRRAQLPSNAISINLPMKIAVGRPRGAMEFYAADIEYDGLWSDGNVRAWAIGIATQ